MADAAELIVRIIGDVSDIERKLNRTTQAASSFGDKMESAGRKMSNTGRAMTTGLTVPIVALGGFALKTAMDFETAFAGVRKTVDGTEEEFAQLESGIRNMAKQLPASAVEIAGVAEAAGQLGIKKEAILGFTRTMVDLGVATNMSSDEAATALARLANITQMPQDEFDRLGATVVHLGNNLATTEGEIVEFGLRIAGAGNVVGMTEHEIMAFAGAMSSLGINAEAGGTAISRAFIKIATAVDEGGEGLEAFAEVAGMSSEKFSTAFKDNAAGAMASFIEGLGRVQDSGGSLFKVLGDLGMQDIRLRDSMLRLAGGGDILRDSLEMAAFAWDENTALTEEAGRRYETTASKLAMFWNRVKDAAMTLGAELVPALLGAMEAAEPLGRFAISAVQWFGALPGPVKTFIIALAGIVAIAGPILVAVGAVVTAIGAIAPVVAFVAGAISAPILLMVAGLALIGAAAYLLVKNWDTIKAAAGAAWDWIWEKVGAVVEAILGFLGRLIDGVVGFAQEWGILLLGPIGAIWKFRDQIGETLGNVVGFFLSLPGRIIGAISSLAGRLWDSAWEAGFSFLQGITEMFGQVVDFVAGAPGQILGALGDLDMLWDAGWQIMLGLRDGIVDGLRAVKDFVGGIAGKIISWKGPPEYDARLLVPAGMSIMDSLVDGLQAHEKRLAAQLATTSGMIGAIGTSVTVNRSAAPAGGIDYDRLAAAIVDALKRGGVGGTNVFPAGTDPMHMAREIAWRTGG